MAATAHNPLLSSASDSSLSVQLHPLVLLTISDYVTRHTLRSQQGPIIGAIVGQQKGREVTMEHAFQCKLKAGEALNGEERVIVDEEWFAERLDQFRDVHKAPALDLVALFTLGPQSGPGPQHVPALQQLQHLYNDALILLLFHPATVLDGALTGGKLPIALYESHYEPGTEDGDKGLQVEGWGMGRQQQMKFRELSFEVETGEAEMIGVDFVAKGGGNATAIQSTVNTQEKPKASKTSAKGKGKASAEQTNVASRDVPLSSEDEELLNSITGKANAIKMLHQRISLIKSYLSALPPSYLADASLPASATETGANEGLNHPLLRNISALISRLPLLAPPSITTTMTPTTPSPPPSTSLSTSETSDVHLISLLATLTRTIADARDFGAKYQVVQRARQDKRMAGLARGDPSGRAFNAFGGNMDDFTPGSEYEGGPPELGMV